MIDILSPRQITSSVMLQAKFYGLLESERLLLREVGFYWPSYSTLPGFLIFVHLYCISPLLGATSLPTIASTTLLPKKVNLVYKVANQLRAVQANVSFKSSERRDNSSIYIYWAYCQQPNNDCYSG